MKLAIIAAFVAAAYADHPIPHPKAVHVPHPAPHPAPYRPPAPHAYKEEVLPPKPFAYQYGVADDYSGANFQKTENQDDYGNLQGSYRVALPDGRVQIVTYKADHENGFIADVAYEGQAVYPPEPKEGYGHAAPKYKPVAPKYVPAPPPPKYPA